MEQKTCTHCGRLYPPQAPNQLYCDDVCSRRAYVLRRKWRRLRTTAPTTASVGDYWNTYFTQCFTSADNALAQQIFSAALANPAKRYCVFNWLSPESITRPQSIAVTPETHEGITYYAIRSQPADTITALAPQAPPVPLFEEADDLDARIAAIMATPKQI